MGLRNPSGQSVIEYAVIIMVIVAAAVFGGPFLVNSINARFQIMENNTQDAYHENIRQDGNIEAGSVMCVCSPGTQQVATWPAYGCGENGCGPFERNHRRSCSPLQCDTESGCVADAACCTSPVAVRCGDVAPLVNVDLSGGLQLPSSVLVGDLCASRDTVDPPQVAPFMPWVSSVLGQCKDPGGSLRGCRVGEKLYEATCGTNLKRYVCVPDADCAAVCINDVPGSQPCPGSTVSGRVEEEVFFRQQSGVPGMLPDNPSRTIHAVILAEDPTGATVGALRMPNAYVSSCSTAIHRGCERNCPLGKAPKTDGTGCLTTCGNGICEANQGENCQNCQADCGYAEPVCTGTYTESCPPGPNCQTPGCSCGYGPSGCECYRTVNCGPWGQNCPQNSQCTILGLYCSDNQCGPGENYINNPVDCQDQWASCSGAGAGCQTQGAVCTNAASTPNGFMFYGQNFLNGWYCLCPAATPYEASVGGVWKCVQCRSGADCTSGNCTNGTCVP